MSQFLSFNIKRSFHIQLLKDVQFNKAIFQFVISEIAVKYNYGVIGQQMRGI